MSTIAKLPLRSPQLRQRVEAAMRSGLDSLEPHTQRAYRRGLAAFAEWLTAQGEIDVVDDLDARIETGGRYLLSRDAPTANALVELYAAELLFPEDPEAPRLARSTVDVRISALRWAVRHARRMGLVVWALDVRLPKVRKDEHGRLIEAPGRDMSPPSRVEARRMIQKAREADDPRAWFVVSAVLREGLREHELRQLDSPDDVDLPGRALWMVRKKRAQRERYPLSDDTLDALRQWIRDRGPEPGPLLNGGFNGGSDERVSATSIWRIIRRIGDEAGVSETSPHKCRHRAVTDLVHAATREGLPEEELLRLTGHSSRTALQPYYEHTRDSMAIRRVLNNRVEEEAEQR